MSYFEDYIEDGLCCEGCGAYLDGGEPGFVRYCAGCETHPDCDKVTGIAYLPPEEKRLSCQIGGCGERFTTKAEKRRHRRNVHGAAQ